MKRIIVTLYCIAMSVAFSPAFAQSFFVTTVAPEGETFNEDLNTTTSNGFIGSGTSTTVLNARSRLTFPAAKTSSITTPAFFYEAETSTIFFRINLDPSAVIEDLVYPVVIMNYGNGGSEKKEFYGDGFNLAAGAQDYYFQLDLEDAMPSGEKFSITMEISGLETDIVTIDFATNASKSGDNIYLPVKFGHFSASEVADGIKLSWIIDAEENTSGYEIERSKDGIHYTSIASVETNELRTYSYTDRQPLAEGFYRIKAYDYDNRFGYSSVVRVQKKSGNNMRAYISAPGQAILQSTAAFSSGRIFICNAEGKILTVKNIAEGGFQSTIDLSSTPKGLFILRYETSNGDVVVFKMMKL